MSAEGAKIRELNCRQQTYRYKVRIKLRIRQVIWVLNRRETSLLAQFDALAFELPDPEDSVHVHHSPGDKSNTGYGE